MIYVDTSVVLAQLLAEDRRPPARLWDEPLVSSRLLEYETWTRVHGEGLTSSHGEVARQILGRVSMLELSPGVLSRALDPWPVRARTLDALHLASLAFLRDRRMAVPLATYDERMLSAARKLKFPLYDLGARRA